MTPPRTTSGHAGPTEEVLVRVLQGVASPQERRLVEEWRDRSPGNAEYLRELTLVWQGLEEGFPASAAPDPLALIQRGNSIASHPSRRSRWARVWVPAVAAALVALAVNLERVWEGRMMSGPILKAVEVRTGPGERKTIELSDGTVVQLAPGSRIVATPLQGLRQVEVEGRVFVAVAKHGPEWPFVIHGGGAQARVLGTRFEFASEAGQVSVLVLDGLVSLAVGDSEVLVRENQAAAALAGELLVQEAEDVEGALGWMGRSLLFQPGLFTSP